jgi:CBS domain containing-hemolysin-like protein
MNKLTFYKADTSDELAQPTQTDSITIHSPALLVFTDFKNVSPLVIESSVSASEAERLMQASHVRLKMVVDKRNHFLGVVSLDDLNNQEVIKRISQGFRREELTVSDFMRSRDMLMAFSYSELLNASIQDVIDALQASGQQHCLVVDREKHDIRGIISASDIARKLKLPIDIDKGSNFAKISRAIYHQIHPKQKIVGLH